MHINLWLMLNFYSLLVQFFYLVYWIINTNMGVDIRLMIEQSCMELLCMLIFRKNFYFNRCFLFMSPWWCPWSVFTNGSTPSPNCLDDFLRNSNRLVMKAIFICTFSWIEWFRIYWILKEYTVIVLMVKSMVLSIIKVNLMDLKCYKTYAWLRVISINGTAYKMNKYRKKSWKITQNIMKTMKKWKNTSNI